MVINNGFIIVYGIHNPRTSSYESITYTFPITFPRKVIGVSVTATYSSADVSSTTSATIRGECKDKFNSLTTSTIKLSNAVQKRIILIGF